MTSKQIEVFLTVAKYNSFTLAADALFMSQPTISRQISLLEEELGFDLFVRGNNYLEITPQGEIMVQAFQRSKNMMDKEVETALSVKDGHVGSLTVGFISDINIPDFLIDAMYSFQKQYPGVKLHYVCKPRTTFYEDLHNHIIDVMLTHEIEFKKYQNYLNSEQITTTHMGIFYGARHPLADKPDLRVSDLKDEIDWAARFADTPERRDLNKKVTDYYDMPEFQIKIADSTSEMVYLLRMGIGISIMDCLIWKNLPEDIHILKVDPKVSTVNVSLFWDKENLNPCIPHFLSILKNSAQVYEN